MSSLESVSPDSPEKPVLPVKKIGLAALFALVSAILMVGCETATAAAAISWAVTGVFHLSGIISISLYGVMLALAAIATVKFGMIAWASEKAAA